MTISFGWIEAGCRRMKHCKLDKLLGPWSECILLLNLCMDLTSVCMEVFLVRPFGWFYDLFSAGNPLGSVAIWYKD